MQKTQGNTMEIQPLLTIKQVASMLNIGYRTVQYMTSDRVIPCIKIGRTTRYDVKDVEKFIENCKVN